MSKKGRLISIVIPTYNRLNLLKETVKCALSQNYENIEVIVLDNNSKDGTYKYLSDKYKRNTKFSIYKNNDTVYIVDNWIKCLSYAKGHYCLLLWSDDLINKNFISKSADLLNENEEIAFVYTKTKIFINDIMKGRFVYGLSSTGIFPSEEFISKSLLYPPLSVPVSPANALFRTKDLKKNLIRNIKNDQSINFTKFGQGNDNLIFLLTLNNYKKFGYINECLAYFRDHKDSLTMSTDSLLVTYRYHSAKRFYILTMSDSKFKKNLICKYNTKLFFLNCVMRLTKRNECTDFRSLYIREESTRLNVIYLIYIIYLYFIHLLKTKIYQIF
jgi:glycosyltransferase involved in cell wall biosynthesis